MARISLVVAVVTLAVGCGGGGAPDRQTASKDTGQQTTAVVTLSERAKSNAGGLRSKVDAEMVKVLPKSQSEVWRLAPSELDELRQLATAGDLVHVEITDQNALPAVPPATSDQPALSADQLSRVQLLTAGLAPGDFRVSGDRAVTLTADLLADALPDRPNQQTLSLDLVGGRRVLFKPTVTGNTGGQMSLSGPVVGAPGSITLVLGAEGVTGTVTVGADRYTITPVGGGRQLITRVNADQFPPDHPPKMDGAPARPPEADVFDPPACPTDGEQIDLIVAYTSPVRKALVDPAAFVASAIDTTNQTFADSAVGARVRLAWSGEVSYAETGSVVKDLNALRETADGKLDDLHVSGNKLKADVIVLITESGDACGIAGAIPATLATGVAIVIRNCAVGNFSFPHELGHLFGARHDLAADGTNTPFAHGHGYTHGDWRTIMAYPGTCGCSRLGFWSNPNKAYPDKQGKLQPTGKTDCCDNASVIRKTAGRVASFRCKPSPTEP